MITDLKNNPVSNLNVGDEIKVQTLFGIYPMIVMKKDGEGATAETKSGGMGAFLSLGADGFWDSDTSYNPKAVCKVLLVD